MYLFSCVQLFFTGFKRINLCNIYLVHIVYLGAYCYIIGYLGYLIYVFNTCLGSVCSRRREPVNTETEICRDDRSMVTTGNKCVSPSQENAEMVNLVSSNQGLDPGKKQNLSSLYLSCEFFWL